MVKVMNTTLAKKDGRGFTIVELLIVIVIIGILATLVIVTFAGAQRKARNTKTIANVRAYYNMIEAYYASNGHYPATPNEGQGTVTMVCLGLGYENGSCGIITGTQVYESEEFMDEIKSTLGGGTSNQTINDVAGAVGDESFIGAAYGVDVWLHGGTGRTIQWFLEGEDQECSLPKSYRYNTSNGNTACEIGLEPYPLP